MHFQIALKLRESLGRVKIHIHVHTRLPFGDAKSVLRTQVKSTGQLQFARTDDVLPAFDLLSFQLGAVLRCTTLDSNFHLTDTDFGERCDL